VGALLRWDVGRSFLLLPSHAGKLSQLGHLKTRVGRGYFKVMEELDRVQTPKAQFFLSNAAAVSPPFKGTVTHPKKV
jgi:hypothetical protein